LKARRAAKAIPYTRGSFFVLTFGAMNLILDCAALLAQ
jgi:hypothetical protein